jgi:hypothetical protein
VRKLLAANEIGQANLWCDVTEKRYNKPFTDEQMIRVFGEFFDITNKKKHVEMLLSFKDVANTAIEFLSSQYDKSDVDLMFNAILVQSLKEYKLTYVEYILEKGITFGPQKKDSHEAFYDNNFRKTNKHTGQPMVMAKPLSGWLTYLSGMSIKHQSFMPFGYKVYFEGKKDCDSPADVLNKAPEWQRQYILPFLGAL